MMYPPLTKILYLIQLQSHYTPAPALTDNQAVSVETSIPQKPFAAKPFPWGDKTLSKGGMEGEAFGVGGVG